MDHLPFDVLLQMPQSQKHTPTEAEITEWCLDIICLLLAIHRATNIQYV